MWIEYAFSKFMNFLLLYSNDREFFFHTTLHQIQPRQDYCAWQPEHLYTTIIIIIDSQSKYYFWSNNQCYQTNIIIYYITGHPTFKSTWNSRVSEGFSKTFLVNSKPEAQVFNLLFKRWQTMWTLYFSKQ